MEKEGLEGVKEWGEIWARAVEEVEWAEISQGLDLVEIVSARIAGQKFRISREFPAIH